jgi:hypothetical protein
LNLKNWFHSPASTITYDYNKPELTPGLMGDHLAHGYMAQDATPPPQLLFNLASYWTPFCKVWRQPRNVISG